MAYELMIGNKNYSSWSLRPWVLMRTTGIGFDETLVPFHDSAAWDTFRALTPGGQVPLLRDGARLIWDSLAITEYLAERHPGIWPENPDARAFARSAAAQMHSGFGTLRSVCGMNIGVRVRLHGVSSALQADIDRLSALWHTGLEQFGGPYLAGDAFSAADAFFCPVAFRFQTYGLQAPQGALAYVAHLLAQPAMQDWYRDGLAETFRDLPHDAEIPDAGVLTQDLRAPATAQPGHGA